MYAHTCVTVYLKGIQNGKNPSKYSGIIIYRYDANQPS